MSHEISLFLIISCCRALQPPGWLEMWHCGVRVSKNKKLVGFISAVPAMLKIYDKLVLLKFYKKIILLLHHFKGICENIY